MQMSYIGQLSLHQPLVPRHLPLILCEAVKYGLLIDVENGEHAVNVLVECQAFLSCSFPFSLNDGKCCRVASFQDRLYLLLVREVESVAGPMISQGEDAVCIPRTLAPVMLISLMQHGICSHRRRIGSDESQRQLQALRTMPNMLT